MKPSVVGVGVSAIALLMMGCSSQERAEPAPEAVARAVVEGRANLGVCVDGAGIGSAMAANKVPGARAALCYDEATARNAREPNFANVLSLGGPRQGEDGCLRILQAFLATPEGASRHERRVRKIMEIEARGTGRLQPVQRVLRTPGAT